MHYVFFIHLLRSCKVEQRCRRAYKITLFYNNLFVQIYVKGNKTKLRCPACVSSCAVLVCRGWKLHLITQEWLTWYLSRSSLIYKITWGVLTCTVAMLAGWVSPGQTPLLSSAVCCCAVWRSAWTSLRGLAARLHGVTPRRAGSAASQRWTACITSRLLHSIQGEVPDVRVVCGEIRGFSVRGISPEPCCGPFTSPAKQSSLPLGFMSPDVLMSADAVAPWRPGAIDTSEKKAVIF